MKNSPVRALPGRAALVFLSLGWVALASAISGCASARMSDHESDALFRSRRYDDAAKHLQEGLDKAGGESSRDGLLYMLDLGLALHSAGRYEESNKVFLRADKLAEIKDYTSLSKEAATLLVSENIQDYKAEDFENVLISTYLSMNYALEGNVEDALVEARRVNQKLYRMVSEGGRKYQQSAFARYLSAILYESEGDWNDAYVDYKNAHDLAQTFPGLGLDLWRMAWATHNSEDMRRWDAEFNLSEAGHKTAKALLSGGKYGKGEIIILYENGISPIKKPNPQFESVPKFYPRFNPVAYARVQIRPTGEALAPGGPGAGSLVPAFPFEEAGATVRLDDIQSMAILNLEQKYGSIVAKKVAGMVAKGAAGYGVAKLTKSPLLGELAGLILYKADTADTRSWNLLPQSLQVLRIPVDPGMYEIEVDPVGAGPLPHKVVQVPSGKKVFIDFRYMP